MRKKMCCKHWHEDDFGIGLREICKANSRTVTCCGNKDRCDYPNCYEDDKRNE